jgi:hypothetical protein
MTKKDLQKKIAELEKRVQELESAPRIVTYPVYVPMAPMLPLTPFTPYRPLEIWCDRTHGDVGLSPEIICGV